MAEQFHDQLSWGDWQVEQLRRNDAAIDEMIFRRFGIPVPETVPLEAVRITKEHPVTEEKPERKSA